jgi:3-deoxy-manno-octulosonate cytidylyltransferase (CMP-KDO synthetase)
MKKGLVIIPARYQSTRFPGKPLVLLKDKPLIQHVWERAIMAKNVEKVIVATDHSGIFEKVKEFGGECIMTSPFHKTGTERVAEVAKKFDFEIIVNVQGDEPMIEPELIDKIIEVLNCEKISMASIYEVWDDKNEFLNPNTVKVVMDKDEFALYFSRSPIPYSKDNSTFFRHVGIYGYKRNILFNLVSFPQTFLELKEGLEQLRAIENGVRIKMIRSDKKTIGVDTPEDLEKIREVLK